MKQKGFFFIMYVTTSILLGQCIFPLFVHEQICSDKVNFFDFCWESDHGLPDIA